MVAPGESIVFTSDIVDRGSYSFEYHWSVSSGEIVQGQGTSRITVVNSKVSGESLVASVEVKVLSNKCESLTTDYGYVYPMHVDEIRSFGLKLEKDMNKRLDNFAILLRSDPNATAYILGYFSKSESEFTVKRDLDIIRNYLIKNRKSDAVSITFATEKTDSDTKIQFWIVPSGAMPPVA